MTILEQQPRPVDERGFTLLEMVVAVVILVLITGAISAAFVTSISSSRSTKHVVSATQDAQLISGLFTRDALAAGGTNPATGHQDPSLGVTTPAPAGSFNNGCNAPGTPLIGFKWIDQATDTTYESNYSYVASATGTYKAQQFLRTLCSTPPAASTSTATSVLANNVITTATGSFSVPAAWCDNNQGQNPPATCPFAPPNTAALPNTASLSLTILNTTENATSPYPFTLTANVRPQSGLNPDLSPSSPTAPLLLLGTSSNCSGTPSITGSNNQQLQIFGQAAIDGCPASGVGNKAPSASGGTYVWVPSPPPPPPFDPCANIQGTCTPVTARFVDPFKPLIDSGTIPVPSSAGCNGTPNPGPVNGHYQPGTYPRALNTGGATVTFDPGTYVFCAGLTTGGKVTANGVLFYFKNGSLAVGNGSNLTLSPPTSGTYAGWGLTLWEDQADTVESTSGTSNTIVVNINGTYYAPSALMGLQNGQIHILQLIAQGIDLTTGNGNTYIGAPPPITITSPNTLPNGTQGQPYPNTTVTASGGFGSYTYTAQGLPAGLGINASTGVISGTPTGSGTFSAATVTVTDVFVDSTSKTFPTFTISPTVASLTSANHNGKPEQSDTITITFNSAIDPTSVCSTWANGANTLSTTSTVLTLTKNSSGDDTLSVSDPSCALHIFAGGSLDLGTSGYVTSATAVFAQPVSCNGGNHCSAIAIDATDKVLTITLGDLTSGNIASVSNNPGITYHPDASITAGGLGMTGTASDAGKFF